MEILTAIIEILVGGFTEMAAGIGGGLNEFVKSVFLSQSGAEGATWGLSLFGTLVVVFAGIALAIGLSRWIVSWLTSFGN